MKREVSTAKGIIIISFFAIISVALIYFASKEIEDKEIDEVKNIVILDYEEEGVVDANNRFAFDIFQELTKDENIFFSPYSIFSALAMTYEGANGETEKEIKDVFYFPKKEELRGAFSNLYQIINQSNKDYELNTANALWVHTDHSFLDEYKQITSTYYGADITNLDFLRRTEVSRKTINDYIEEKTKNRIKDLIPEGSLDSLTKMVITNAIYFKGGWDVEFDKNKTHEATFYGKDDSFAVEMMALDYDDMEFNYYKDEDVEVIELPYKGESVSMFIFLPKDDKWFEAISNDDFNSYKEKMNISTIDAIFLPKFELETKYFMKNILSSMGMGSAFSEGVADFSAMDGTNNLFIDNVIHQAFVLVDEEGTEAAAATAVIMRATSMPLNQVIFRADRQFFFVIEENNTKNILFIGKIVDPR